MSFDVRELVRWWDEAGFTHRVLDPRGEAIHAPAITLDDVVFDHREATTRSMFCAVQGENTHGVRFLRDAFAAGVPVALVQGDVPRLDDVEGVVLAIGDPREALSIAAKAWLIDRGPVVVGITGSNGKTTTKDFLAAALRGDRDAQASPGNRNSGWGLPAAVLGFRGDEDVLVLEMGASGPGEIGRLAAIGRPWMGCVTNVGPAHVEFFGSVDGVAQTKGQLLEALPENGVAVINRDDAYHDQFRRRTGARNVVTFGTHEDADLRIERAEAVLEGIAVRIGGIDAVLPVFGTANAHNAAAAMLMAEALGVRREDALARIAQASLSPHRSLRLSVGGRHVIDDAYNANPASVAAALRSLATIGTGRRVAVLGDMAELGDEGIAMHREVLGIALECGLDAVAIVGPLYAHAAEGAEDPRIARFAAGEADAVGRWIEQSTETGDVVLLKGSRSARLERALEAFVGRVEPSHGEAR